MPFFQHASHLQAVTAGIVCGGMVVGGGEVGFGVLVEDADVAPDATT